MTGARSPGASALAALSEPDDGSLVFVPFGDPLLTHSGQAGAQLAAEAGLAVLPTLPAPSLLAIVPNDLPPVDGVMLDMLPRLPAVPNPAAAAAAAAVSTGRATQRRPAAGRGGKQDKQAIARERNRLAQQRFREKERQKIAEAEAEAEALRRQLSQLRLEHEQLQLEQALLEKLLVVRNAILSVAAELDSLPQQAQQQVEPEVLAAPQMPGWPAAAGGRDAAGGPAAVAGGLSVAALLQDPAALQAASQQLAMVLGELPSLDQVEQLVGEVGGSSNDGGRGSGGSSGGGGCGASGGGGSKAGTSSGTPATFGAGAPASASAAQGGAAAADLASTAACLPPISATAEAAVASGLAIEQSRLREVAPSPCHSARKAVESIEQVECLLEDWRQWRQELRVLFHAAQARQFSDRRQVDALEAHMRSFVEVFWAACHVRPQLFNLFLARSLPPPHVAASAEWARIARESLPLLSGADLAVFRRAMQRYTKRVAIAAVGVRPWVTRLQAVLAAQRDGVASMHHSAAQHAQVRQVASRLHYACTEHYLAYMGLLADIAANSSAVLRALWHSSSDPFAPDHPAIISQILRLHQQRPQQQQQAQQAQQQPALAVPAAAPAAAREQQ